MAYSVFLKKHEDKRIRAGHPWVYANEVDHIDGKGSNGDLAAVYDAHGSLLGRGYINHTSKILVRLFLHGEETDDKEFYKQRIRAADDYRRRLGYRDCYRMAFGEAACSCSAWASTGGAH